MGQVRESQLLVYTSSLDVFSVDFALTTRRNVCFYLPEDEYNALRTVQTSSMSPAVFYAYAMLGTYCEIAESAGSAFPMLRTIEGRLLKTAMEYVKDTIGAGELLRVGRFI